MSIVFTVFWFGENFLNVGVYAAGAKEVTLSLVGGGGHDWNYSLAPLIVDYCKSVGMVFRTAG
ncbi:MAG: hypothetical protein LBQ00_03865 [Syntrophobacterales bacterium]|nr:hypothetical protein [Syntrophobacterales bacterium]